MTIAAHAPPPLLAAYASGSLGAGMSLLVACHLTFCPRCRDAAARLDALGGALLAATPPEPMEPPGVAAALDRIDAPARPAPEPPVSLPEAPLPAPLRWRLHGCGSGIRWRRLLPGFAEHRIDGFAAERVSLYRGRPGVRIPAHGHTGREGTLVLCGRLRDGAAELGPGDLGLCDADDHHGPEVVGAEPCVCLSVQEGRRRFTGPLGPVLNLLRG